MKLTIYTDGSWNKHTKVGAWAYSIESDAGHYIEDSGYSLKTTNNRMEMNAIIQALIYVKENIVSKDYTITSIEVNTDSAYSIKIIDSLLKQEVQEDLHPNVKNSHLINYARDLVNNLNCKVSLNHVAGHSTCEQNNYIDRLAVSKRHEAEKLLTKSRASYYAEKNAVSYY